MLNSFDFEKYKYKYENEKGSDLREEFGLLQRKLKEFGIPVIILIDGWESAGKGYVINDLVREVNNKYTKVHVIDAMTDEEKAKPFLWRFWERIPAKGDIAVFDRSFYYDIMDNYKISDKKFKTYLEELETIERQLTDDGTLILKFFLNITQKTQAERIDSYKKDEFKKVLVGDRDLRQRADYDKYKQHFNDVLEKTNFKGSKWHLVPSESMKKASYEVLGISIDIIKKTIFKYMESGSISEPYSIEFPKGEKVIENLDYSKHLTREEYEKEKKKLEGSLASLGYEFHKKKIPTIIIFEGVDAAGKGGAIKRLTKCFDPRGYDVVPISAPTELENSYNYMWRFWNVIPPKGRMVIFDRSWYGRVLVERIESFASEFEWKRAYREINETEKLLKKSGMLVLKFFLAIDSKEQLKRFNERLLDLGKEYKLTSEDWRNREKWDLYIEAYDDMLARTSTDHTPWIVIPGNDKYYARIRVMKEVLKRGREFIDSLKDANSF